MPIQNAVSTDQDPGQDSASIPASAGHAPWRATPDAPRVDHGRAAPAIGSVAHFSQDCAIYAEGDPAETFFQVLEGVVRSCRFLGNGHRQIDAFPVAGWVFGLEPDGRRRHSAEAVSDCTVIVYRREAHDGFAANGVEAAQLVSQALRNMARAQDHVSLLGRMSAMGRVAGFLEEWARHSPGARTIALPMTRQDIGDYLGLTVETVSRALSRLERDAVIERPTARRIRFKNREALRALTN